MAAQKGVDTERPRDTGASDATSMSSEAPDGRRPSATSPGNAGGQADPDSAEVARRAYRHFEERGGRHGDDQADWFRAEQELRNERGD